MTTGYRRMGEQYLPHYGLSDAHRNAFVHRLEGLMMPYIERLADETRETGLQPEAIARDRETIQRLLARFMTTPSKAEVECFGSLPFSDDVLEGGEQPLAAPLTEKELAENHLFHKLFALSGKTKKPVRESAWYEGSVVRCGKLSAIICGMYTLYKWMRYSRKQMQTQRGKRRDQNMIDAQQGKQYAFVIRQLTARELKRKYARSYLGVIWSVLNPLLSMVVLSLIFSQLFRRSIENYPIYYLTGNILWQAFTVATNSSMTSLVEQ